MRPMQSTRRRPRGPCCGLRKCQTFEFDGMAKNGEGEIGSEQPAFCYPWAIAPTINTTKPAATAIATFVSTDKFIVFSLQLWRRPRRPRFFFFPFLDGFEFPRAFGCHAQREGGRSRRRRGFEIRDRGM